MASIERTLSIIKPDAAAQPGVSGEILARFERAGLEIIAMKKIRLSEELARGFYAVHKERSFYNDLVAFMTEGPIYAQILEGENAGAHHREVMGATNPKEAKAGTVRALYATNIERNACHGSDSPDNAAIEIAFFFAGSSLL